MPYTGGSKTAGSALSSSAVLVPQQSLAFDRLGGHPCATVALAELAGVCELVLDMEAQAVHSHEFVDVVEAPLSDAEAPATVEAEVPPAVNSPHPG